MPASLLGAQRPNLLGQLLLRKALQINKLCTATHTAPVLHKTRKVTSPGTKLEDVDNVPSCASGSNVFSLTSVIISEDDKILTST